MGVGLESVAVGYVADGAVRARDPLLGYEVCEGGGADLDGGEGGDEGVAAGLGVGVDGRVAGCCEGCGDRCWCS